MQHDHSHCLEAKAGPQGLPRDAFEAFLAKAADGARALIAAHEQGTLAHLAIASRTHDLDQIDQTAKAIAARADDVVVLGTGGSSLGGQTLAQVAGWHAPFGLDGARPRLHFADNLDARSLALLFAGLKLETSHFIVISKSGGTVETLAQMLLAVQALTGAGLPLPAHITAISDPPSDKPNPLRDFLGGKGVTILDHEQGLGGRYSALSNVGLLPAAIAGLDIAAVRRGAAGAAASLLEGPLDETCAPLAGAALSAGLASARGCTISVLMAYADRLERFTRWHAQLWAESLGKQGLGCTPVSALGPVDQHSQLQLYLDGPNDKMFTIIMTAAQGQGPRIADDLARKAGIPALAGKSIGAIVEAMQRATADTLAARGRPVRTLRIETLDAAAIGALMMHFMIETMITAHCLGVDPFDQPAVEDGKRLAMRYLGES